jgi:hypothetical protein
MDCLNDRLNDCRAKDPAWLRSRLRAALAVTALAQAGCTLETAVTDDPAGNASSNAYRAGPAARSVALWSEPGENLLASLVEVEENDRNVVLPVDNRVLGNFFGELGAYFSASTVYTPFESAFEPETMQCQDSELPDAAEELCATLEGARPDNDRPDPPQLVVINELPHAAYQRSLVRKLLPCARAAGFTHLAVEALEEDDAALEARGYVSHTVSGPFAREPQLARLLEEGLSLGYDLVSYQVADPCTDCRHVEAITRDAEEQARNLVAKTFAIDPAAKVLVMTSSKQAYKRLWGNNMPYIESIASYLWDQTGIEPLSIEQVAIDLPAVAFGASSAAPPSGMYVATPETDGRCMGSYSPGSPTGVGLLDAIVLHVPPHVDDRRWDWLHAPAEERRSLTTECAACDPGQRVLVQAFAADSDRADRVPLDQALCTTGAPCELVLPAGSYEMVVWSETAPLGTSRVDLGAADTAAITF